MTPFSALDPIFGEQLLLAPREGEIVFFPRFRSRPLVLFAFGLVHTGQWEGCCVCRKGGGFRNGDIFLLRDSELFAYALRRRFALVGKLSRSVLEPSNWDQRCPAFPSS